MKNKDKVVKKEKSSKIKFKGSILILPIIYLIIVITSYFFVDLIGALIVAALLLIVMLIGKILDSKKKSKGRKILKILLIIFLIFAILALIGGCLFIYYIVKNAPDFEAELLKERESTIIYDNKGNEYAKLGKEIRENIEYNQISEEFIDALVATEDSRFFQHNGFDLMRFSKAAVGQVMGNGDAGGGSTLTMQVAKNTFTDAKADSGIKGIIRKFTDIYISIFEIERNYTKEEIIEFYINNHDLVGIISGIQEASQYFFGKDAKDLNLAESSLLAGLYQAPTYYNPRNYPERATKRRSTVLYLMVKHGYITDAERKIVESIPVSSLLVKDNTERNVYQGYIDLVCKEVNELYGVDPYSTPMLIYTNMDRSKQNSINDILNGKGFSWKDELLQAGIAVVDSGSGKILAIGSGRNQTGAKSYSYATDINRQIGSTAKPLFDYAPGMEYNNWSTYTLFDDEKGYTYSNGKKINNFDGRWEGIITLRRALSNSRNIPALKAFQSVDNKKIIDLVTSVGIKPEISNGVIHEAHSIGSFTGSNPLTMAGAYQIFSNGGYYYKPYAVYKITFRNTNETVENSSPKVKIISDSTSYMLADVLKDVDKDNSNTRGGLKDVHFGVKTGTTNVDSDTKKARKLPSNIVRDYWINGFTHDTVVSIWIGYDELNGTNYLDYNRDGNIRRKLLNAVGKAVFKRDGVDFTQPKSVVKSKVEKLSDPPMLPSANTPGDQIVYELFKRGTEPTQVSTKYLALNAPTDLDAQYQKDTDSVLLTWNGVTDLGYIEDGVFGYYIYFNDSQVAFTTSTSYVLTKFTSFIGKYSVRAGYKDTTNCLSAPDNYNIYNLVNYRLTISGKQESTYNVNDNINKSLYNGSIVVLYADDEIVTNGVEISRTIKNSKGEIVNDIDNTKKNTYTITYKVKYDSFSGEISNKIIIVDNTPEPESKPPEENSEGGNNNNNNNNNNNGNSNNKKGNEG